MKTPHLLLIIFILLFTSCSREEQYPTLVADFELAKATYLINEPVEIGEVTLAAVQYLWDFGNGKTSNEQFPKDVTYEDSGIYPITLTIRSVGGGETTVQKNVIVG